LILLLVWCLRGRGLVPSFVLVLGVDGAGVGVCGLGIVGCDGGVVDRGGEFLGTVGALRAGDVTWTRREGLRVRAAGLARRRLGVWSVGLRGW
jgi:hypothetical protein